ncbi:MAG: ABC-2 transporter permease [Defluviitaleaceae bacterium]|nr:ABC-2 transporter permease [Defluviitaleaceae bacterium]
MLNMMRLDLLGMKSFRLNMFLRMLIPIALLLFSSEPIFVILMAAYFMQDNVFYTFVTEEKGQLNHLYMTLPVNRKIIVRARFLLILIFLLVGITIGTILSIVGSMLLYGRTIILPHSFVPSFNAMLLTISVSVLICGIVNLPSLPILLKTGYIRGKLIGFYLPSCAMAVFILVATVLVNEYEPFREVVFPIVEWALRNTLSTSAVLLGVAVLLFAASYFLAQRVYAKREF